MGLSNLLQKIVLRNKIKISVLVTSLKTVLEFTTSAICQEKEIRELEFGEEEVKTTF